MSLEEFSNSDILIQIPLIIKYADHYLELKNGVIVECSSVAEKLHHYSYNLLNSGVTLQEGLPIIIQKHKYNVDYPAITRRDLSPQIDLESLIDKTASSIASTFNFVKNLSKTYASMKDLLHYTADEYATIELVINVSKIGTVIYSAAIGGYLITQSGIDSVKSLIYVGIEKYDGQDELSLWFVNNAALNARQAVIIDNALRGDAYLVGATTVDVAVAGHAVYDAYQYYYAENDKTNIMDMNNELFHNHDSEMVDVI